MKKLIVTLLFITNSVFAGSKPIIRCEAEGQKNNDITIELSATDKNGSVTDILRDKVGNAISLEQAHERRLIWNTKILENEYNLHVSLEDGIMKMNKIKTGKQFGAIANIKCKNIEEALVFEMLQKSKSE